MERGYRRTRRWKDRSAIRTRPEIEPVSQEVVAAPQAPGYSLYSVRGIAIATFMGSVLAGALLISRNYRALGEWDCSRNAIVIGSLGLLLVLIGAVYLPEPPEEYEKLVSFLYQGLQVAAVSFAARRTLGASLDAHSSTGGHFYSNWRAAGMGLLVCLGLLALLFLYVMYTLSAA